MDTSFLQTNQVKTIEIKEYHEREDWENLDTPENIHLIQLVRGKPQNITSYCAPMIDSPCGIYRYDSIYFYPVVEHREVVLNLELKSDTLLKLLESILWLEIRNYNKSNCIETFFEGQKAPEGSPQFFMKEYGYNSSGQLINVLSSSGIVFDAIQEPIEPGANPSSTCSISYDKDNRMEKININNKYGRNIKFDLYYDKEDFNTEIIGIIDNEVYYKALIKYK
ncbi:MAG: hypothetical protein JKY52_11575 [Flavobacteriales bacterium]|nr:hypothetical protein [Flavobacteriales bacterium]